MNLKICKKKKKKFDKSIHLCDIQIVIKKVVYRHQLKLRNEKLIISFKI